MSLIDLVATVPDYPQPGVLFRDITPLLLHPGALREVTAQFVDRFGNRGIDRVAAIESRGFIFGGPLAVELGCGLVPVRKVGKLPRQTRSREYALEYGTNHLEMHEDSVERGDRVLIVDDVLATGGTARATAEIVEELGGEVIAIACLIELTELGGRTTLGERQVETLLAY